MATIIDRCFGTLAYRQGGSFEKAILDAWYLASWSNRKPLEAAYPDMFPEDMMSMGTDNRYAFMDVCCYDEWKYAYDVAKMNGYFDKPKGEDYKAEKYLAFLTMEEGVENECWDEIAERSRKVASLSCELRCELEELASDIDKVDGWLTDDEYSHYDVEDWANSVSEIEQIFMCLT